MHLWWSPLPFFALSSYILGRSLSLSLVSSLGSFWLSDRRVFFFPPPPSYLLFTACHKDVRDLPHLSPAPPPPPPPTPYPPFSGGVTLFALVKPREREGEEVVIRYRMSRGGREEGSPETSGGREMYKKPPRGERNNILNHSHIFLCALPLGSCTSKRCSHNAIKYYEKNFHVEQQEDQQKTLCRYDNSKSQLLMLTPCWRQRDRGRKFFYWDQYGHKGIIPRRRRSSTREDPRSSPKN